MSALEKATKRWGRADVVDGDALSEQETLAPVDGSSLTFFFTNTWSDATTTRSPQSWSADPNYKGSA